MNMLIDWTSVGIDIFKVLHPILNIADHGERLGNNRDFSLIVFGYMWFEKIEENAFR